MLDGFCFCSCVSDSNLKSICGYETNLEDHDARIIQDCILLMFSLCILVPGVCVYSLKIESNK